MRRGLIEEKKIAQDVWGKMKRESLLLDLMMIGFPGAAWMMTEALDVVLMKIGSLAVRQMMTGLPGVVQMMTGLPDELEMKIEEAGVMWMTTDRLDEAWTRTEETGGQPMRTEDQDVGWMRTGGRGEVLMRTGVPGGAWMMTGDLGGMPMMKESPGAVRMMTGGLGETWMMTGSQGGLMMIGFPAEGVMTPQDLVSGDHSSSQVDGERKKKPEKRVGVHLENQDHRKIVNGIEKKKEREMVKIVMRTTKTQSEKGTERETGIERIASDDQGMRVTGEEDQPRKLQAGEIQVAVTIGIEMTVVVREMTAVI